MKQTGRCLIIVMGIFLSTNTFAFDSKLGWNVPTTGKLPDFYQICYSETYAGLVNKEHCTSVGYNVEQALGKVTGTIYGLDSVKSYFASVVGCDTLECSPLSESIYYDGSPDTSYGFSFDLDMDGTPDRLKKNAAGVIMYDLSSNGFNEGLTWDGVLSGNYGGSNVTPLATMTDDDGDGFADLMFEDPLGNIYIYGSINGFTHLDEMIYTILPDQVGVFRISNATFYFKNSNGTITSIPFGISTDTPIIGDWDGDGKDDIGVKRGNLFIFKTNTGMTGAVFGNETGDIPIVGLWSIP